ncbi:MAG: hypothetical protein WHV67_05660 [Thermoanaerobaculia bacterium]
MLNIKGIALKSTINYIRLKLDREAFLKFKEELSAGSKNIFETSVLSSSWYDINLLVEIMSKIPEILKRDPKEVWWEMGRHSCEDGLNTVYKIFYKLGSPEFIIKRASQVFNNYYSQGDFFVVSHSLNSAQVQIKNFPLPHPCICTRISGWMERAIELSGGKNVSVKHSLCIFQKASLEEWKANWT